MEKSRKGKLNNKGASMMVAVVIIGILMIFVFSLLLVSYTLYASQNKKPAIRKNAEAANSLSIAMETELEQSNAYKESSLWKYLRCNVLQNSWPYYDPETEGHGEKEAFRKFDLNYQRIDEFKEYFEDEVTQPGELSGFPGNIEICMYWELPEGISDAEKQDPVNIADKTGTKLHMEIACETANQTYVVTNHYVLTQSVANADEKKTLNSFLNSGSVNNRYYNPYNNGIKVGEKWEWKLESRE